MFVCSAKQKNLLGIQSVRAWLTATQTLGQWPQCGLSEELAVAIVSMDNMSIKKTLKQALRIRKRDCLCKHTK